MNALTRSIFKHSLCRLVKKQMAFMLGRQRMTVQGEMDAETQACVTNANLSMRYIELGRELGVIEPKIPEDVYKSYLEHSSILVETNIRGDFGGGGWRKTKSG